MQIAPNIAICILAAGIIYLSAAPKTGAAVYKILCAGCHELSNAQIPLRETLGKLSQKQILRSLVFGAISNIGRPVPNDERRSAMGDD